MVLARSIRPLPRYDFGSYPRPGLRGEWRGGLPWLARIRVVVTAVVILPLLGWWILGIAVGQHSIP